MYRWKYFRTLPNYVRLLFMALISSMAISKVLHVIFSADCLVFFLHYPQKCFNCHFSLLIRLFVVYFEGFHSFYVGFFVKLIFVSRKLKFKEVDILGLCDNQICIQLQNKNVVVMWHLFTTYALQLLKLNLNHWKTHIGDFIFK